MRRLVCRNRRGGAGVVILLLLVGGFALMSGALDWLGLQGLRVAAAQSPVGSYIVSVPGQVGEFVTDLTQNPFEEKKEAQTEGSTKTSATTGIKVSNDMTDRTGILSPNPRSQQADYSLMVGVRNPTREFVAKNSKLFIGNKDASGSDVLKKNTGMEFGEFTWSIGPPVDIMPRGCPNPYASAIANLKTGTAVNKVPTIEDVGKTNTLLEVDYSYDFSTIYKDLDKKLGGETFLVMYRAKFVVFSPEHAQKIEGYKEAYKLKDSAAGGPVSVSRLDTQPYIERGKKLNLLFKIKNANPNAGVFEAIDLKDKEKILLLVPKELTPDPKTVNCKEVTAEPYWKCTIPGLYTGPNLEALRKIKCAPDGCRFNNYAPEQGFSAGYVLTDEPGYNDLDFLASFDAPSTIDKDKIYNIYLVFLEGAYTYHAAMTKGIGVQPG